MQVNAVHSLHARQRQALTLQLHVIAMAIKQVQQNSTPLFYVLEQA